MTAIANPTTPPIIYLDIDGVLNDHAHCHYDRADFSRIKPDCARILQNIVDRSKAIVILISSWGHYVRAGYMTCKGMEKLLQSHGLHLDIRNHLDTTGIPAERSATVNHSITSMELVASGVRFCVLDDLPLAVPNLIRPNPDVGLRPYHIPEALRLLGVAK